MILVFIVLQANSDLAEILYKHLSKAFCKNNLYRQGA